MALLADLDRGSDVPLYRQLRAALERGILTGQIGVGTRLPSSRELSAQLAVSRNTVVTAYQELVAEGYVTPVSRSGLVVNPELTRRPAAPSGGRLDWSARLDPLPGHGLPLSNRPPDWYRYPYPFLGGQPSPDLFPKQAWLRALRDALEPPHHWASLQDAQDADDPLLLDALCQHILPARGIEATPAEVMVTLGTQQGHSLVTAALLGPGRRMAVENPGYPDLWHIAASTGASLVPVPVDAAGLIPGPELATVDVVTVTPSHQYPTNVTLSVGRRQQLLDAADQHGLVIVEDDYDSEFRYQGSPSPALKALDSGGHVVYLGSFSKFLAPGLRLGFLVADAALVAHLRERRRFQVRHAPGHQQRALALLISSGDYARALRRARTHLKERWQTTVDAVGAELGWGGPYPSGGTGLWVVGPPDLDSVALAAAARRLGVLVEPSAAYYLTSGAGAALKIGFASVRTDRIAPGIAKLAEAWRNLPPGSGV